MRTRGLTAKGLTTLAVLIAGLTLGAGPAFGLFVHEYKSQITGTPTGPGGEIVPFGHAWGLAFDKNNDLLVADANGKVIDTFDSTNTFTGVLAEFEFPFEYTRSVAVNNTTGVIYVAESGPEEVFVFKPEAGGKYALIQKRKAGGGYVYVAVNNSSGPHAGDVYVMEGSSTIRVIKPESNGEIVEPGAELSPPQEGFSLLGPNGNGGMSFDEATGTVYVANPGKQTVVEYNSEDVPQPAKLVPPGPFEPVSVAVDQSTGEVYALDAATAAIDEFSRTGAFLGRTKGIITAGELVPFTEPTAIAVKQSAPADVYVSDGTAIDVLGPDTERVPAITIRNVSNIAVTEASVLASVNPNEANMTCSVQYGTTTAYGLETPCEPASGDGASPVWTTAALTGLSANTTYHYRFRASSSAGTVSGADQQFTTFPAPPPTKEAGESNQDPVLPGITIASLPQSAPQPLLTLPPIAFPTDEAAGTTPKSLTNAQKLANALKVCHAKHNKKKRATCEAQARKRYPPTKSKRGKK